jgi:hypothetical protein
MEKRLINILNTGKKPCCVFVLLAILVLAPFAAGLVPLAAADAQTNMASQIPQSTADEDFIVSYNENVIGLGDGYLDFLGTPDTSRQQTENVIEKGDHHQIDTFNGLLVDYYYRASSKTREICCVQFTSGDLKTSRGISLGDNMADVLRSYPEIDPNAAEMQVKVVWYDQNSGDPLSDRIFFYFDDNGLVNSIILERQSITGLESAQKD